MTSIHSRSQRQNLSTFSKVSHLAGYVPCAFSKTFQFNDDSQILKSASNLFSSSITCSLISVPSTEWGDANLKIQRSRHLPTKSHHPLNTKRPLSTSSSPEPAYQLPNMPWLPHPDPPGMHLYQDWKVAGTDAIGRCGARGRGDGKG